MQIEEITNNMVQLFAKSIRSFWKDNREQDKKIIEAILQLQKFSKLPLQKSNCTKDLRKIFAEFLSLFFI